MIIACLICIVFLLFLITLCLGAMNTNLQSLVKIEFARYKGSGNYPPEEVKALRKEIRR